MENRHCEAGQAWEKRRTRRQRILHKLASVARLLVIPLVIVLYIAILIYNLNEGERRSLQLEQENSAAEGVHVSLKIQSVDVARAEMTARVQFQLKGAIAKDAFTPAVNLRFLVNAVNGQQRFEFPRNERLIPFDVVFALDGDPNFYPFDTHQATLAFVAAKPSQGRKPPPRAVPEKSPSILERIPKAGEQDADAKSVDRDALIGQTELAGHMPVPVSFDLSASVSGLKFESVPATASHDEVTRIQLKLRRADNVITASLIIQSIMIGLALSMLAMVLFGTIKGTGHAIDPLFIAPVLIFGLPALRDTQPGVPPLGAFSDYLSYFWAEIIVATSTIIAIWTWIARRRPEIEAPSTTATDATQEASRSP